MLRIKKIFFLIIFTCFLFFVLAIPPVYKLKFDNSAKSAKDWVPFDKISINLIEAVLASEDANFFRHHGFDFREILISFKVNWEAKSYIRGASTITQQLVRLEYLSSEKTVFRKVRELLGAVVLELLIDKKSIFENYINKVTFGPSIVGINKASSSYFDTDVELLSINQSILLVLLIPRPNVRFKLIENRFLSPDMQRRFKNIANALLVKGVITNEQFQSVIATGDFGSPLKN